MFKDTDKITLAVGDAQIAFPAQAVLTALLARLRGAAPPVRVIVPAIGADFHGGKYAGLTVHDNDPAELVLLPGEFEGPWGKAKAWAEEQGGVLPSRIDQNVLWKNLKSEFRPEYYWSSEPCADAAGFAWGQYFSYGFQDYLHIGTSYYRARAVRRVIL
jgi:hypothetical protein